ncbi:hypothetical protein HOLDEFILI_02220 [Holdemania filiformis DSM 12042]|uniref:Uncharacterized protein n=1 Tax=Holdemania filiformis DSM 12042 TaxID=545696 RepID=B9Y8S2_9FIRM|nr:hypothetical protein HOLDEFILI_02220 [Holdemania filiformis DSM 12042]
MVNQQTRIEFPIALCAKGSPRLYKSKCNSSGLKAAFTFSIHTPHFSQQKQKKHLHIETF